jgi:hypothetical protein
VGRLADLALHRMRFTRLGRGSTLPRRSATRCRICVGQRHRCRSGRAYTVFSQAPCSGDDYAIMASLWTASSAESAPRHCLKTPFRSA